MTNAATFPSVMGRWPSRLALVGVCAALVSGPVLRAGETSDSKATTTTAVTEEEPKNWIELALGGTILDGDKAQFEQEHHLPGDTVYGGIQDLHYEQKIGEKAQLVLDGHALWDFNDYNFKLDLSQQNLGYLRAGINEFRSWYDGNGGWFPHHGVFFEPPIPEMHVDRGEVWVELGLQLPDWPELVFHYSHIWRQGEKDSTIWGDTTLTGLAVNPARKIAPAYRDIKEKRDFFTFDATKAFGDTSITLGMRYEHDDNDDKLQLERGAGQLPPRVNPPGAQRFITQADSTNSDMFSGHIFTETHVKDWLWFTTGYSYTTFSSDLTGSRIVGPFYNAGINEPIITLQSNDHSFINLAGTAQNNEHIFNANVLFIPAKDVTLLSGFRYTYENTDADSVFLDINTTANVAPFNPITNPRGGFHRAAAVPRLGVSSNHFNNFSERLELRYTGIDNWLFYMEGEWEDEFGNVKEHEVVNGVDEGTLNKDPSLLAQKYTIGVNWYPMPLLTISSQYYYKIADYDTDFNSELFTPPVPGSERNQRLLGQDWDTQDANIRITLRPKVPEYLGTMSLVTRFDYVQSAISGKWAISPNVTGAPPTNTILNEERTGLVTNYMATETLNWNPLPRLYFQQSFSYVLDQTKSPVNSINLITVGGNATGPVYPSPSVITARNDYYTLTSTAGYLIDDKTELTVGYNFYRAPDWFKNPVVAMPYGIGATEHCASVGVSREISKNLRVQLKYTYFNYADETFGGHNNYRAHSIYSSLQFRF